MRRSIQTSLILVCALTLAACNRGMVKRVSEPAASLQQLTVGADGNWSLDVRVQNYSSIPMRFDDIALQLSVGEQQAGTLQAKPGVSIGPTSADVVKVTLQPTSAARLVVADALARNRSLGYQLKGNISALPQEKKTRSFEVDTRSTLTPAPGLPGVLR